MGKKILLAQNEKRKRHFWVFIYLEYYIKLWSGLLELFIKHKPRLSEECYVLLYLKSLRIKTETEYHNVKEIIDYLKSDPLSYELILRWIMAHAAIHTLFLKFQAISINCVIIFFVFVYTFSAFMPFYVWKWGHFFVIWSFLHWIVWWIHIRIVTFLWMRYRKFRNVLLCFDFFSI